MKHLPGTHCSVFYTCILSSSHVTVTQLKFETVNVGIFRWIAVTSDHDLVSNNGHSRYCCVKRSIEIYFTWQYLKKNIFFFVSEMTEHFVLFSESFVAVYVESAGFMNHTCLHGLADHTKLSYWPLEIWYTSFFNLSSIELKHGEMIIRNVNHSTYLSCGITVNGHLILMLLSENHKVRAKVSFVDKNLSVPYIGNTKLRTKIPDLLHRWSMTRELPVTSPAQIILLLSQYP